MPAAEVDVTADLVRRLIAAQHPDLAALPVEFLANGWDNTIWRLGDERLVRLPRRELGARIILHEQRWMPVIEGRLPLKIPSPERIGAPALGYPYSWSVVPLLPGIPAADAEFLDMPVVVAQLAAFLGALHVPAPPDAPANPFRGVPLADRADMLEANLDALGGEVDREAVLRLWADALAAPVYGGPPAWLHGDLHPANILIDDAVISGVIDFGDITAGDPASDLAVAWMLLPLGSHGAFREAYRDAGGGGDDDDALWRRARGWALSLAVVFLAHSADNPRLLWVGRRALDAVLA